jgi:hypothetical protein
MVKGNQMPNSPDIAFLKKMDKRAKDLACEIGDEDHWAKPYDSDINTFVPGVQTAFIGINHAGDKISKDIYEEDDAHLRVWSGHRPFHNAYLDERWGTRHEDITGPGCANLQVTVQKVFASIFGDVWSNKLREAACFNLLPVGSKNTKDTKLNPIQVRGIEWGVGVLEYTKPKLIILNGNGEKNPKAILHSSWVEICANFTLEMKPGIKFQPRRYSIKRASITEGPLKNSRIIALPHLSRAKHPWHPDDKYGYNRDALLSALKGMEINF